jgi:hypothetical protein
MSYPWIKDGQYVTPAATNYLAVTSPNGLYLTDGSSPATIITPTSVTSTTFYGTLNGTVSNATNATNATNVAITDDGTTNAAFYPVFVSNNSGNLALKVDKTTTPLSYNPSTGEFLSQSFAATITNGTVFSRLSSTQLQVASVPSNIVTVTSNQITVFTSGTGTTTITPASVTSASFVGALTGNATTATTATNIAGGIASQIPYQSSANTTSFIANGTLGQYLKSNGTSAPSWATIPVIPATPTLQEVLTAGNNAQAPLTLGIQDLSLSTSSIIRGNIIEVEQDDGINVNLTGYTFSGIEHSGTSPFNINSAENGMSVSSNMANPSNGYARLELTAGNLTTTAPKAVLQAFVEYPLSSVSSVINKITLGDNNGEDIIIQNGNNLNALPENTITLHQDATITAQYINLRSAYDDSGLYSTLNLGIQSYDLTIAQQTAMTIGSGATDPVVFRRNISTTTNTASGNPVGMLENSRNDTFVTTLTTTLTISEAFSTTINTPTDGTRAYQLPATSGATIGYWYGICNKSTTFTIAIKNPSGTTIATVPVAPVTGGSSVARFAVGASGTSYFAVDSSDMAITATNIAGGLGGSIPYQTAASTTALLANGTAGQYLKSNGTTLAPSWDTISASTVTITDTNTSGTYYPTFVSASGSGQTLRADITTAPLSYNPSTGTLISQSFSPGNGTTVFSSLSTTALSVINAGSNTTTVNSNQIICSQVSGGLQTTITPTSVTTTTFTGALSGNATTSTRATNIAGGLGGQILYQSALDTTAKLTNGTAGQFLQSNGTTLAPSWVNQNAAATVSLSPTSFPTSGSATLTANFNSSYSSVTRYPVTLVNNNGSITISVNTYALSGGLSGGQYTIVLAITIAAGPGVTLNFNGTGIASGAKFNFTTISNTYGGTTATKYVVLTFAYDGTDYFMSGSNFT